MASKLDLDKVRENLKKFQNNSNSSARDKHMLQLIDGEQTVRIVPYKFNPGYPFKEMYFHYEIGGRTYLSPITEGENDPFVEYADKLKATGDKTDRDMAYKLYPKLRVYAPVIVRGKEDEGVKFWSFSKTIYQELLGILADPDWGDVSDLESGHDLKVTYIPKEKSGKSFAETKISPKPKPSPVVNLKAEGAQELVEKIINEQVSVTDLYTQYSYEEMEDVMNNWLNPSDKEEEEADAPVLGKEKSDLPFDNLEEEEVVDHTDEIKGKIDSLFAKKNK